MTARRSFVARLIEAKSQPRETGDGDKLEELVLAELLRQREDNSQRQSNMIARVSITIAGNTVVLVPLFADGLDNLRSWPGSLWLIPILPAAFSVVFGFTAIGLWTSKGSESTADEIGVWRASTYGRVLDRLIVDQLELLKTARLDLRRKSTWHRRSVAALSWTAVTMVLVFVATTLIG